MPDRFDARSWIGARIFPTRSDTLTNVVGAAGPPLLFGVRLCIAFWLQLENAYWAGTTAALVAMARREKIALIAHDNKKEELVEWARFNCKLLAEHSLCSTSTTGQLLKNKLGLKVTLLECGPFGGDQQIWSRISEGQIDFVIFFSDPLQSQPHDSDVKAPRRITVVLEHSRRMQPRFRRLHRRIATDVNGVRARRYLLFKIQRPPACRLAFRTCWDWI